jgi:hypothetical protein
MGKISVLLPCAAWIGFERRFMNTRANRGAARKEETGTVRVTGETVSGMGAGSLSKASVSWAGF